MRDSNYIEYLKRETLEKDKKKSHFSWDVLTLFIFIIIFASFLLH